MQCIAVVEGDNRPVLLRPDFLEQGADPGIAARRTIFLTVNSSEQFGMRFQIAMRIVHLQERDLLHVIIFASGMPLKTLDLLGTFPI